MEILNKIRSSADVKRLSVTETLKLCSELREQILQSVSRSGGHLASNLGSVELTVALHRVYEPEKDKIVFDVGHQCYAHKMLTGRLNEFSTLRQFGGLSGFPKPKESPADPCIAGHASTSISNALGLARARTLSHSKYDVCAVIGDGAMTGGLSYEGLCDCGASGEPIVVVLNDNNMSIGHNVGGLAHLLSNLRVRQSYIDLKTAYHKAIGKSTGLYKVLHTVKEGAKNLVLPDNMFEDMGFYYLGPVDGHDEQLLERALRYCRSLGVPVLLHVLTVKGKGYLPAETNPSAYHGVGPFDVRTGISGQEKPSFSRQFGETLCELAAENPKIVAVTAAMADGTGLIPFKNKFPDRFYDVGIAEEHAVSMAAGLAAGGLSPVFAVYSSFLQRGYDMMIHDVSLSSLHVVFAVDRAGLVGADGETHQGSFDVCYLRTVPGMRLLAPSSYAELGSMLAWAVQADGPIAIRYPRGGEGGYRENSFPQKSCLLTEGDGPVLLSYGILINNVLHAAELLKNDGIFPTIVKVNELSAGSLDLEILRGKNILIAEDCSDQGCLGQEIMEAAVEKNIPISGCRFLNLGSGIIPHGSVEKLWNLCHLDAAGIYHAAKEFYTNEQNSSGSAAV